jgi:hypothetical protein
MMRSYLDKKYPCSTYFIEMTSKQQYQKFRSSSRSGLIQVMSKKLNIAPNKRHKNHGIFLAEPSDLTGIKIWTPSKTKTGFRQPFRPGF